MRYLVIALLCLAPAAAQAQGASARDLLGAIGSPAFAVLAACTDLKGECVWLRQSPMPSPEACAQFGRKLQLERGRPMNDFRCRKIEVHP